MKEKNNQHNNKALFISIKMLLLSLRIIRQEIKLVGLFFTWMPLYCHVWKFSCTRWGVIFFDSFIFYHNEYALLERRIDRLKMKRSNHFFRRCEWKSNFWQIVYSYHDWFMCVCMLTIGYSSIILYSLFWHIFYWKKINIWENYWENFNTQLPLDDDEFCAWNLQDN